jgi:hypothetical protein
MAIRVETYDEATWEKEEREGMLEVTLVSPKSRLVVAEKAGILYIVAKDGCITR